MDCRKCSGRGFYLDKEIIEGGRHIIMCECEPSEKYKRMHETVKRIKAYEPGGNKDDS